MSNPVSHQTPDPHRHQEFDTEVRPGPILAIVFGLAAIIALSMILMWWFSGSLKDKRVELDPAPSPIPEASERRLPPGPQLQASPELELIEMNREYEALLTSYGWADKRNGIAHIPVARAIELIAERGLPGAPSLALVPPGAITPGELGQAVNGEVTEEDLVDGTNSAGGESQQ